MTIDANTVNTILRRVTAGIKEIQDIWIEPEEGELRITVRVKKGVAFTLRGLATTPKVKDGYLGFRIERMSAFGFLSIPQWVIRRVVDNYPPENVTYYPEDDVIVVNLNPVLPPELYIDVRDIEFENGEIKVRFGPSQYRLDRIIEEIGKDPFAED